MSDNRSDLVTIRAATEDDRSFIFATWLRGLYYGGIFFSEIPKDTFMANYHKIIDKIISSPNTRVSVACLKEDPSVILGYSVYRKSNNDNVLDWIFVKSAWRLIGIAKSLTPAGVTTASHITKLGKKLMPKGVSFNPFV